VKAWQLQEAKSRFSELVQNAQAGEAQVVTKHGKEVAVVLDYLRYLELTGGKRSVREALKGGPDLTELGLERDRTPVPVTRFE